MSAIQASQQALDAASAGLGQMPADPGIGQARQDVQRVRGTMTELQRQAEGFCDAVNQVEQALAREPNADPAVVDASYPRDLSATGARGHFTIRMHLCGGDCG